MNKRLTIFALVLFFFSGTIYTVRDCNQYQFPMLLAGVILILLTNLGSIRYIHLPDNPVEFFYVMFVFPMYVTFITTGEISIFLSATGVLTLWFVCCNCLPSNRDKYSRLVNCLYGIVLIPFFFLIFYGLFVRPIKLVRYRSFFKTTNGLGDAAATASLICFAQILCFNQGTSSKKKIINYILLAACVMLALVSTCRGAILTIFILAMLTIFVKMHNSGDIKSFIKVILGVVFFICLGVLLYKFTKLGNAVDGVIEKFVDKSADALDGRGDKWDVIFSRLTLFGNGENTGVAAHNSIFSVLDQYGIIAALNIFLFMLFGLLIGFKKALSKDKPDLIKYLPLLCFTAFCAMSMTESMMMKTSMLLCVFCIPLYSDRFYGDLCDIRGIVKHEV